MPTEMKAYLIDRHGCAETMEISELTPDLYVPVMINASIGRRKILEYNPSARQDIRFRLSHGSGRKKPVYIEHAEEGTPRPHWCCDAPGSDNPSLTDAEIDEALRGLNEGHRR